MRRTAVSLPRLLYSNRPGNRSIFLLHTPSRKVTWTETSPAVGIDIGVCKGSCRWARHVLPTCDHPYAGINHSTAVRVRNLTSPFRTTRVRSSDPCPLCINDTCPTRVFRSVNLYTHKKTPWPPYWAGVLSPQPSSGRNSDNQDSDPTLSRNIAASLTANNSPIIVYKFF